MTAPLTGRLVRLDRLSDDDIAAWRRLGASALEPNPFFEAGHFLPAFRFYGTPDMRLAVAESDGTMHAAVPVTALPRWHGLRRRVWKSPGMTDSVSLATPLVSPERPADALGALLGALGREGPGITVLEWVADDGPVAAALRGAAAARRVPLFEYETWERGALFRSAHLDGDFWGGSERNRRKLERQERALGRDLDGKVVVVDRTLDEDIVERFLQLEAAGWKGHAPNGLAWLQKPDGGAWFREVFPALRDENRVTVLSLEVGGRVLALTCVLRRTDHAFFWRTCYDEDYGKFSPGILMLQRVAEHVMQRTDAETYDSSTYAGNDYLLRAFPDRRRLATYLVGTGGTLDRTLVRAFPAAKAMHGRVYDWQRARRPRLQE